LNVKFQYSDVTSHINTLKESTQSHLDKILNNKKNMFLTTKTLDKKEDNEKRTSSEVPKQEIRIYQHPESDESFLDERPSKVEEVIECLEAIENANKQSE